MNQPKPTDIITIANRIDSDVLTISALSNCADINTSLAGILRATRELRGHYAGPASVAEEIASGYHQAITDQVEGLAALLSQMPRTELLNPQTIQHCEMLSTIVAGIQHNYVRAAQAAQAEFDSLLAVAEQSFVAKGHSTARPLDIDGEPIDEREAA